MPQKPWLENSQPSPSKPWLDEEQQSFDNEPLLSNANLFSNSLFGTRPEVDASPVELSEFQPSSTLQAPPQGKPSLSKPFSLGDALGDLTDTGTSLISKGVEKGAKFIGNTLHEARGGLQQIVGEPVPRYNQFRQDEVLGDGVQGAIPLTINQLKYEAGTTPLTNLGLTLFNTKKEQRGLLENFGDNDPQAVTLGDSKSIEALKDSEKGSFFQSLQKANSQALNVGFGKQTVLAEFLSGVAGRFADPSSNVQDPTGNVAIDAFKLAGEEGSGMLKMIADGIPQIAHLSNELAVATEDLFGKPRGSLMGSDDPASQFKAVKDRGTDKMPDRGVLASAVDMLYRATHDGDVLTDETYRKLANEVEAKPELAIFAVEMAKSLPSIAKATVKGAGKIPTSFGVKEGGKFGATENLRQTFDNAIQGYIHDPIAEANKSKTFKEVSRETKLREVTNSPEFKFQQKLDKAEDVAVKRKADRKKKQKIIDKAGEKQRVTESPVQKKIRDNILKANNDVKPMSKKEWGKARRQKALDNLNKAYEERTGNALLEPEKASEEQLKKVSKRENLSLEEERVITEESYTDYLRNQQAESKQALSKAITGKSYKEPPKGKIVNVSEVMDVIDSPKSTGDASSVSDAIPIKATSSGKNEKTKGDAEKKNSSPRKISVSEAIKKGGAYGAGVVGFFAIDALFNSQSDDEKKNNTFASILKGAGMLPFIVGGRGKEGGKEVGFYLKSTDYLKSKFNQKNNRVTGDRLLESLSSAVRHGRITKAEGDYMASYIKDLPDLKKSMTWDEFEPMLHNSFPVVERVVKEATNDGEISEEKREEFYEELTERYYGEGASEADREQAVDDIVRDIDAGVENLDSEIATAIENTSKTKSVAEDYYKSKKQKDLFGEQDYSSIPVKELKKMIDYEYLNSEDFYGEIGSYSNDFPILKKEYKSLGSLSSKLNLFLEEAIGFKIDEAQEPYRDSWEEEAIRNFEDQIKETGLSEGETSHMNFTVGENFDRYTESPTYLDEINHGSFFENVSAHFSDFDQNLLWWDRSTHYDNLRIKPKRGELITGSARIVQELQSDWLQKRLAKNDRELDAIFHKIGKLNDSIQESILVSDLMSGLEYNHINRVLTYMASKNLLTYVGHSQLRRNEALAKDLGSKFMTIPHGADRPIIKDNISAFDLEDAISEKYKKEVPYEKTIERLGEMPKGRSRKKLSDMIPKEFKRVLSIAKEHKGTYRELVFKLYSENSKLSNARKADVRAKEKLPRHIAPPIPLGKTWEDLGVRTAISESIQEGQRLFAWTPSEVHIERWSDTYSEAYKNTYDVRMVKAVNSFAESMGWEQRVQKGRAGEDVGEVWFIEIPEEALAPKAISFTSSDIIKRTAQIVGGVSAFIAYKQLTSEDDGEERVDSPRPSLRIQEALLGFVGIVGGRRDHRETMRKGKKATDRINFMIDNLKSSSKNFTDEGGFSADVNTFKQFKGSGYLVGIKDVGKGLDPKDVTVDKIYSLVEENNYLWGQIDVPTTIGLWFDKGSNKVFVDISVVLPETKTGLRVAERIGYYTNQKEMGRIWTDKDGSGGFEPIVLDKKRSGSLEATNSELLSLLDQTVDRVNVDQRGDGQYLLHSGKRNLIDGQMKSVPISRLAWDKKMKERWGKDLTKKDLDKFHRESLRKYQSTIESVVSKIPNKRKLLGLMDDGAVLFRDWGKREARTWTDWFGDKAEIAGDISAIMSANSSLKGNASKFVGLMMAYVRSDKKAFGEIIKNNGKNVLLSQEVLLSELFDGKNWVTKRLSGGNRKIANMALLNRGDPYAIPVDLWMQRLFGFSKKVDVGVEGRDAPSINQNNFIEAYIRELSDQTGWTPSEVQGTLWSAFMEERGGGNPVGVSARLAILMRHQKLGDLSGVESKEVSKLLKSLDRDINNPPEISSYDLTHYSPDKLNEIKPSFVRTGADAGREALHIAGNWYWVGSPVKNLKGSKAPEARLGGVKHELKADLSLYDLEEDLHGYYNKHEGDFVRLEKTLKRKRYDGWIKDSDLELELRRSRKEISEDLGFSGKLTKKDASEVDAIFAGERSKQAFVFEKLVPTKAIDIFSGKRLFSALLPLIGAGATLSAWNSLTLDEKKKIAGMPFLMAFLGIAKSKKFKKEEPLNIKNAREEIRSQHHMTSKAPMFSKLKQSTPIYNIRKWMFDMNARVFDFQENVELQTQRKLHGEEAPYNLLTSVNRTAQSKAEQWINYQTADFDGKVTGESLRSIVEDIVSDGHDAQDVLDFTYARHARERIMNGKEAGIDYDVADIIFREDKDKYEKYADRIVDYRRRVLDYVVDAGGLPQETADMFRKIYEYSVPLYRVMEDGTNGGGHGVGGRGYGDLPSPIKRAKGSDLPVNNILGNLMYETYRMISFSDRVRVGQSIINASNLVEGGMPTWIQEVPPKMVVKMKRSLGDVMKQVKTELSKLDDIEMDIWGNEKVDWEQMMTFWGQEVTGIPKENVITFWKDGEMKMYKLDSELYKAVKAIDPPSLEQTFGFLGKVATFPKKVVTAGATGWRASFGLVTNALRDPFTMAMQSRTLLTMPTEVVLGQYKVAMKKLYGKGSTTTDLYFQQGGDMSNMINSEIPKALTNARRVLKDAEHAQFKEWLGFDRTKKKNDMYLRHPFDAYREIINLPESAPRLTEFNKEYSKVFKKTGNHRTAWIEAFNSSKDVTVNFSRVGTVGYVINQIVPFFNAQLQDYSVFYRTMKRNPMGSIIKGVAGLTIPTLMLWNMNKDKEWYRALPSWRKIGFWNFKIGDSPIMSIPRPFSWGLIFASMIEIAIDNAYRQDKKKTMAELEQVLSYASPPLLNGSFYADVPWVGTLIEANQGATGYSNFMNRPLISQYVVDNTIPSERWNRYTTETAKKVGKILGVAPIKVDHIIRGMTGGLGLDAIRAFEKSPIGKKAIEREPFLSRIMTPPPFQNYLYGRMDYLNEQSLLIGAKNKKDVTREESILVLQKKWLKKKLDKLSKVKKNILAIITSDLSRDQKNELVTEFDRRVEELAKDYTHEYLLVSDAKKKLLKGSTK